MKARLKFSCPAKWEEMQVGLVSRHCLHCSKDVVDLTRMSKDDFVNFLIQKKGAEVCARVRKDQVVWHGHEPEFIVRRPAVPAKRGRSSMQLMALMGLALSSCGDAETEDGTLTLTDTITVTGPRTQASVDSTAEADEKAIDGEEAIAKGSDRSDLEHYVGFIFPEPDDSLMNLSLPGANWPDVQAEFIGGYDSLYAFLGRVIEYPEWDLEHKVSGRIVAEFSVAEDGTLHDVHIARSISGQRDLDSVVLSAIAQMPKWKPAELHGSPVSSRMRLPVVFDLSE